jgi:endonuclease G, mitochondrial
MNTRYLFLFITALLCHYLIPAQSIENQISRQQLRIDSIVKIKALLDAQLEELKLAKIRRDLHASGLPVVLPGNEITWHSAMALEYAEEYEQPRWVAHIIPYDVVTGSFTRSNDFRVDTLIKTGTANERDFFIAIEQPDKTIKYDGFGFDRGHMAPSADFRWSSKALSESYLYSNMSPQVAELNREAWGKVEDKVRGYLYGKPGVQLYVVTGPVLKPGLKLIERAINKVSIPEQYWKVVIDPVNKKGIGFIMPNRAITEPVESFIVPIKEVEKLTGLNFFSGFAKEVQDNLEAQHNIAEWFPETTNGNVEPVAIAELKRGQINTMIARDWIGSKSEVSVCGTVVSARVSKAGNILLNLDKQFPNQVFTVFIRKENIPNFSYNPVKSLQGKRITVKGKIVGLDNLPAMFIDSESQMEDN